MSRKYERRLVEGLEEIKTYLNILNTDIGGDTNLTVHDIEENIRGLTLEKAKDKQEKEYEKAKEKKEKSTRDRLEKKGIQEDTYYEALFKYAGFVEGQEFVIKDNFPKVFKRVFGLARSPEMETIVSLIDYDNNRTISRLGFLNFYERWQKSKLDMVDYLAWEEGQKSRFRREKDFDLDCECDADSSGSECDDSSYGSSNGSESESESESESDNSD